MVRDILIGLFLFLYLSFSYSCPTLFGSLSSEQIQTLHQEVKNFFVENRIKSIDEYIMFFEEGEIPKHWPKDLPAALGLTSLEPLFFERKKNLL